MANVRWIDRIHRTSNFTDCEMTYLQSAIGSTVLKQEGLQEWQMSDGSIGSIGQAILRSNKYFTDCEMM